ncbi:hypothetical protein [Nocardia brasiliensis]|uniref:hypothetical protein n=1 Tax=Nocardia brasiliensis TaxID=37326 RepID=UPI00366FC055
MTTADDQIDDIAVTLDKLGPLDGIEILILSDRVQDHAVLDHVRTQIGPVAELRWRAWQPGTAALNTIFEHARAEWVLYLRPRTQLCDTALAGLLQFIATQPHCTDLLQGPQQLNPEPLQAQSLEPIWHDGRLGVPDKRPRSGSSSGAITEIGMHELALFACRKDCWPGVDPRLGMHEGPPGYLHKKFRALGRRTLSLPALGWTDTAVHPRQGQSSDTTQFFRYLLCWEDIGQAIEPIIEHFTEYRGPLWVQQHLAQWDASRNNPFDAFDALVCINSDQQPDRWSRMLPRFAALGIADKVQRLPATWTPQRYTIGCALSHRRAIAAARENGLESILVFEDDAVFLQGAIWVLRHSVAELMTLPWKLFYLGGFYSDQKNPHGTDGPEPTGQFLRHAPGLVTLHAIAYHQRAFDQLLDELPADATTMGEFLNGHGGHIDVYLADTFHDGVYRCAPTIATQESYLHLEHTYLRDQFLLDP